MSLPVLRGNICEVYAREGPKFAAAAIASNAGQGQAVGSGAVTFVQSGLGADLEPKILQAVAVGLLGEPQIAAGEMVPFGSQPRIRLSTALRAEFGCALPIVIAQAHNGRVMNESVSFDN